MSHPPERPPAAILDPELRARLLSRHLEDAFKLLADALHRWRASSFRRFSDRETSCTVRVYGCMEELLDEEVSDDPQVFPLYDLVRLTRDHLDGYANPDSAKRPDLTLALGGNRRHRIYVECKRLGLGATARQYVDDGLMRFVRAKYPTHEGRGAMIGYVQSRTIAERVGEINGHIESHAELGPADCLVAQQPLGPIADVHESSHHSTADEDLRLSHLFVDMRSAAPPTNGVKPTP